MPSSRFYRTSRTIFRLTNVCIRRTGHIWGNCGGKVLDTWLSPLLVDLLKKNLRQVFVHLLYLEEGYT